MNSKMKKMLNRAGFSVIGGTVGTLVAGPIGTGLGATIGGIIEPLLADSISAVIEGTIEDAFEPISDASIDSRQLTFKEIWSRCSEEINSVDINADNFYDLHISEKKRCIPQHEIYGSLNCCIAIKSLFLEMSKIESDSTHSDLDIATAVTAKFCDGIVNTAIFKHSKIHLHGAYPHIFDDRFKNIDDNFPLKIETALFELCCPNNRYDFYVGWKRNCTVIHTEISLRTKLNEPIAPLTILRSRMLDIMSTAIRDVSETE